MWTSRQSVPGMTVRRTAGRDALDRISDTRVRWIPDATMRPPAVRADAQLQEVGSVVREIERRSDTLCVHWSEWITSGDGTSASRRPYGSCE